MTRPMQLVFFFSLTVIVVLLIAISSDSRGLSLPIGSQGWLGVRLAGPGASSPFPRSFPPDYHPYRCGWSATFFDDFNGNSLDYTKWNTNYPAGERERQHYTRDAFELDNGLLKIRADQRQVDGREYASGIITTQGLFEQQNGRFEIRAKMPAGKGMWPAFWLLPASKNYPLELDVLEVLGHEPDTVHMSHHWPDENGNTQDVTYSYTGPDFSSGFHNFSLEWSPDGLIWRVDGIERARAEEGIPHEPMFMLVNLAVGGAWPGDPDETTPFPGYYQVDYVRASRWFCDL